MKVIDLEGRIHHETDMAILFSTDGRRKNAVWLPKSAIETHDVSSRITEVTMPEQLAIDKDLI